MVKTKRNNLIQIQKPRNLIKKKGYDNWYIRIMINGKVVEKSTHSPDLMFSKMVLEEFLRREVFPLKFSLNKDDFQKSNEKSKKNNKTSKTTRLKDRTKEKPTKKNDLNKNWEDYFSVMKKKNLSKSQINIKKLVRKHLENYGISSYRDFTNNGMGKLFTFYREHYKDDSIHKFMSEIKCFLNYSIKQGVYQVDQYRKIDWLKTVKKVKDLIIKDEDIKTILNNLKTNDFDFYVYIYSLINLCGRPNEIFHVQVKNFDFKRKTCKVYMNKTKKTKEVILTDKDYLEFMKDYLKGKSNNDYICNGHLQGYFFYSKKFIKLKKRLGLNPEYTLYTFRHTVGTKIYRETKDTKFGSSQLGDTVDVFIKHYVNTNIEDYREKYLK